MQGFVLLALLVLLSFFNSVKCFAAEDIILGNSPDDDFMRSDLDIKGDIKNDIKSDITSDITKAPSSAMQKPKRQLGKDFASNPKNFQNNKSNLEQDGGFFINQKNAVDSKQIPKYPDRGANKGLVGGLLNVLNEDETGQAKESQVVEVKTNETKKVSDLKVNLTEEKSGGFFDKLKQIAKSAGSFFSSGDKKSDPKQEVKPAKKTNAADNFPNPTFYKINKTDKFYKIPISILNDKTNVENLHIPTIDISEDYKILYLLFLNIKGESKQEQIRAMLDYIKNKNLINMPDQYGNTLLVYAVRFNNLQSFHSLMEYGANPNVCNKSGLCPIHLAIFNHQNYIFDLLLKANTKYNLVDMNGFDPLIYAIYAGNGYAFHKLLELEPYNNLKASDFGYLLQFAEQGENYEIYQFIKNLSVNVNN